MGRGHYGQCVCVCVCVCICLQGTQPMDSSYEDLLFTLINKDNHIWLKKNFKVSRG